MINEVSKDERIMSLEIILATQNLFKKGEYIPRVYDAIFRIKDIVDEQTAILNVSNSNIRQYERNLLNINRIMSQRLILNAVETLGKCSN